MNLSNKSLAGLLVVVVVASLASTMISLHRLDRISFEPPTGKATGSDTATANLTITDQMRINFDVANINFGSGFIEDATGGVDTCDLDTNGTSNTTTYCEGFTLNPNPFIINNTGNGDAALLLRSSYDSTNFTGASANNLLQWWLDNNEPGSCTTTTDPAWSNWANVNNTNHNVCDTAGFNFEEGTDTVELHMRVLIGEDATEVGSERTTTITATADDQQ